MTRDYDALRQKQEKLRSAVLPGLYRHYKGDIYRFEKIVFEKENEEPKVNYHPEDMPGLTWSVSLEEWNSKVEHEGEMVARYAWLEGEIGSFAISGAGVTTEVASDPQGPGQA